MPTKSASKRKPLLAPLVSRPWIAIACAAAARVIAVVFVFRLERARLVAGFNADAETDLIQLDSAVGHVVVRLGAIRQFIA